MYERALAWGHYSRGQRELTDPELVRSSGIALGGYKYRMQQLNAAIGRGQLRHYDDREREIRSAMNRFWDLLDDCPGIRGHRVDEATGSTMGGWYNPHGLYAAEELGGTLPDPLPGCPGGGGGGAPGGRHQHAAAPAPAVP